MIKNLAEYDNQFMVKDRDDPKLATQVIEFKGRDRNYVLYQVKSKFKNFDYVNDHLLKVILPHFRYVPPNTKNLLLGHEKYFNLSDRPGVSLAFIQRNSIITKQQQNAIDRVEEVRKQLQKRIAAQKRELSRVSEIQTAPKVAMSGKTRNVRPLSRQTSGARSNSRLVSRPVSSNLKRSSGSTTSLNGLRAKQKEADNQVLFAAKEANKVYRHECRPMNTAVFIGKTTLILGLMKCGRFLGQVIVIQWMDDELYQVEIGITKETQYYFPGSASMLVGQPYEQFGFDSFNEDEFEGDAHRQFIGVSKTFMISMRKRQRPNGAIGGRRGDSRVGMEVKHYITSWSLNSWAFGALQLYHKPANQVEYCGSNLRIQKNPNGSFHFCSYQQIREIETHNRREASAALRKKGRTKVPILAFIQKAQATYELDFCVKTDVETGEVSFDLARLKF